MKKAAVFLTFFIFLFISIPGCGRMHTAASPHRAVTSIDIVTKQGDALIRRHYTEPKKMQNVLIFLRLLKPQGKPDLDPENLTTDMFLIAVNRSDGTTGYYRQTGHRYFAKDDQSWFSVDPEYAARLYALMVHIPSDPLPEMPESTNPPNG